MSISMPLDLCGRNFRHAQCLVADSAVDAAILRRGAHRSSGAEEKAAEAQQVARRERQRAEEAIERWFAEEDVRG
ncbi:hypothetical protein [Lentzea sp. NPDC092896]|uniref:hypothetical protein n=1 Tax=Lentzea sp. NPDC092896 TaxID=3364127 RepID=UPI003813C4A3